MKKIKIFLYPIILFFIAYIYMKAYDKSIFINYINIVFLANLPVFTISVLLYTIQKGLYSPLRYSMKRFAIFFFKEKRNKLMQETDSKNAQEMEEKMKEKYLYSTPSFTYLKYTLLQSIGVFIITFVIAAMY